MSLTFSETPDHIVIPTRVSLAAYGAALRSHVENLALGAGLNNLDVAAVPANKLHVYTNITLRYDGTVATVELACGILVGASYFQLFSQSPPVSTITYDRQGTWVLAAGDVLRMVVVNATAGDDAYLYATGFVVDLT